MYRLYPCGDCAVTVEFSRKIDAEAGKQALRLAGALEEQRALGLCEIIPTYRSVTVCYDPLRLSFKELKRLIARCVKTDDTMLQHTVRRYKIPVCYGGAYGEDLSFVAVHTGLSPREIVYRHISRDYLINMIGFLPGFPYLSGMDESIAVPRMENPREKIPAGAVGIGGVQTGIYPIASPGGWRLIGRTPLRLYDPKREPPVLYSAGDHIRFWPISETEFDAIARDVEAGVYAVESEVIRA